MSSSVSMGQVIGALSVSSLCVLTVALFVSRRRRGSSEAAADGPGRGVLVTGCDSGFGHRLALRLDARGFAVFAGCLSPEGPGARRLAQEGSGRLRVLRLDVTSDGDVQEARTFIQNNLPEKGLWSVVSNAGVLDWAETEWSSIDLYCRLLDVNLLGSIRTTLAFLPLVRASKGRMVYMSSILAFFNCLNMGAYSVSKRGLEAFADCLRVEMQSFGVKVSIIQPGNFGGATDILEGRVSSRDAWETLDGQQKQTFNQEYVRLASDYFVSTSRSGRKEAWPVVEAMLHAVTSPRPCSRYLLVSTVERIFFGLYHLLPTSVSDAIFSLSPMYSRRTKMLYSKR